MVTNMYEAGEILSTIQTIVGGASGKPVVQTPNGLPPVYWPYTIYGRSGMFDLKFEEKTKGTEISISDPQSQQDGLAQTS